MSAPPPSPRPGHGTTLSGRLQPIELRIGECVHCGFCLPACPTYAILGTEIDSPRGRIHLVKALLEGRIEPNESVLAPLDRCLDCKACETACPSGVRYGEIIEHARAALEPERARPAGERWLRALAFRRLLPHRRRLGFALHAASVAKRLLGSAEPFLPERLRRALALVPSDRGPSFTLGSPAVTPATGSSPSRGTVALFTSCVMDHAMGEVHAATARVLARNGFEVIVPPDQTCCGALHVHNGDAVTAKKLAQQNIAALSGARSSAPRIIVNSAGCGAQLREYPALRVWEASDPTAEEVTNFSRRVIDLAAFLVEAGFDPPTGQVPRRAVYDAPCHLHHAQKVTEAPLVLLRAIPGLDLVPLDEADWCCGAAGIYNLLQPEIADRLLQRKVERILRTGADLVITANPGCMIQLAAGLGGLTTSGHREIEVAHLAQVLDWAYA